MNSSEPSPQSTTHPNLILAICCLSLFMVAIDVTIVNVALPSIQRDLHSSMAGLQWSIDGYTVVIASLLMLAGSTADRLGRRRVFQTGLLLFSLGSLLCSLAPTTLILVICRMIQALGGSMLNPVAMSIITNSFVEPKARARAIGMWGAVVGISMAAGPLLGGFLTQTIGWRSIFWINVPIAILAVFLTAKFIPESRAQKTRRIDPVGQVLVVVTLMTMISALIEGPHWGWTSFPIVTMLLVAAGALASLIAYERVRVEPLIDLRFFRSFPFSSATITAVLAFTAFSGFLFLNSLYLQDSRGFSASKAGSCLLPTAIAMMICSPFSGRLVGAGKARIATLIAGIGLALGALLLAQLQVATEMTYLLFAYAIFGIGVGTVNAPITHAAVSGMPRAQAGVAAALASTSRQVGASLGVALAGIFTESHRGDVVGDTLAASTHLFWWLVFGCGITIALLGVIATGEKAQASVTNIAHLLD
jgi:EmrB/QacA subfamily drug resistance transporter